MARNSGILCQEIYREEWRDIYGYAGLYQVSDLGRVRHWDSESWWLVTAQKQEGHKPFVTLSLHQKHWSVAVDRLVMAAFVGPKKGKRIIHLNHDLDDPALDNLQYANKQEYVEWFRAHFISLGKTKWHQQQERASQRKQAHTDRNNEAARRYLSKELSLKAAAETVGISESGLCKWISRHELRA